MVEIVPYISDEHQNSCGCRDRPYSLNSMQEVDRAKRDQRNEGDTEQNTTEYCALLVDQCRFRIHIRLLKSTRNQFFVVEHSKEE